MIETTESFIKVTQATLMCTGLREEDFDEIISQISQDFSKEVGPPSERKSSLLFRT
jgi:hypothetical protein